jgi:outer membrane protein, heavy metal efflux system
VQRELTRSLERRFQEGDVAQWELALARTVFRSTQLASIDARRRAAEAEVLLADAIGLPVAALDGVVLGPMPLESPPPEISVQQARRQALLNRTDILSALADYEAAQQALRLEVARQYPDVRFGPGYEFDQGDNRWGLGISITLPSFNGNRGPIGEAEARREEAAARFEALQTRVLGEIDLALATLGTQEEQVAAAASILAESVEQERRARERREAGAVSGADVFLAHAATLRARQELLRVRVARRQAYLDLETALQSPARLPESFSTAEVSAVSIDKEDTEP